MSIFRKSIPFTVMLVLAGACIVFCIVPQPVPYHAPLLAFDLAPSQLKIGQKLISCYRDDGQLGKFSIQLLESADQFQEYGGARDNIMARW
jgi:hypothetical protein